MIFYQKPRLTLNKTVKKQKVFDNLTMAPIDKELIDESLLSRKEKNWINDYHKRVFHNLKGGMNNTELFDLKIACSAI